jgi:hypothetical protein
MKSDMTVFIRVAVTLKDVDGTTPEERSRKAADQAMELVDGDFFRLSESFLEGYAEASRYTYKPVMVNATDVIDVRDDETEAYYDPDGKRLF